MIESPLEPRSRNSAATRFDPPVKRYQWFPQSDMSFDEFKKIFCDKLKLATEKFDNMITHGGIYVETNRILKETIPEKVFKNVAITLYRFLSEPEDIPLNDKHILYNNQGLVAVNKPAWLPTQGTRVSLLYTLENKLREFLKRPKLTALHRLDRQTSGVVLFSDDEKRIAWVMKQFENNSIHKQYHAWIEKKPEQDTWETTGYMVRDFSRLPKIYFKLAAEKKDDKSRFSHTRFSYKGEKDKLHLIEASPITGRTHQIRVHLKHLGFPIVGDDLYEGNTSIAPRTQLHALSLTLPGLESKKTMILTAPIPEDFITFQKSNYLV
ncbi:RluA family pseudouridine synthase [bacterium]|nr:RluA family pseudouridine synthase [bacterium]